MPSLEKMEKIIEPYEDSWGASSAYTFCTQYRNGEKTARLDEESWFLTKNPRKHYRAALEKVVRDLGLEKEAGLKK